MVESKIITEFYLPKVAAVLSMMGSSLIMAEVAQDSLAKHRQRSGGVSAVSRVLVCMSIGDMFSSL